MRIRAVVATEDNTFSCVVAGLQLEVVKEDVKPSSANSTWIQKVDSIHQDMVSTASY